MTHRRLGGAEAPALAVTLGSLVPSLVDVASATVERPAGSISTALLHAIYDVGLFAALGLAIDLAIFGLESIAGRRRALFYGLVTAVASALGWGAISVVELVPGETLVLSVPLTPEAVYYAARHGGTPTSRLPGLQGLAEALALLVNFVKFGGDGLAPDTYSRLAMNGPELRTQETRSILSGDRECEVAVTLSFDSRPQARGLVVR